MALKRSMLLALLALLAPLAVYAPAARAQVKPAALDTQRSDVVLVIDNSGSMRENDPNFLRLAAAKLFIDLSDPGDKIGIVVQSDSGHTRKLTKSMRLVKERKDIDDLKGMVNGLREETLGGETHMGDALQQAYELLDSTPGNQYARGANQRQFVVLLTDGLPTGGGQRERVDEYALRFRDRGYWKVFSIALGAAADPDYLRRAVADPTGAEVIVAKQDTDLLNSYIDVYARAGDDRFIDRVAVQPNSLAPLVNVEADQQPTQMSVILVRDDPQTRISKLFAPEQQDVVQPFYQNTVRRGSEPEYELYTVPPEAQVGLVGQWAVNVERPSDELLTLVVLSRSRLRIKLQAPAPLQSEDEGSLRYVPVGRPLLLVAGAQIAKYNPARSADQPFTYSWVADMAPVVRAVGPQEGPRVALTDDGREYDQETEDGRYSGLYPPFQTAGDYTLELELPRHTESPIHIRKIYNVRAADLPTMTLALPPGATTLAINAPFNALIELPGRADFQVDRASFPRAFVKRPDGVLDPLTIGPADSGRYHFSYTPSFPGSYRISVIAEIEGHGPMGPVRYIDYAEAQAAVPEAIPVVAASAAFSATLQYDRRGALNIPLRIDSRSPRQERLQVQVEGAPGSRVVPSELVLEPQEAGQRTVTVWLPAGSRPRQGELSIVLTSPQNSVIVQGSKTSAPFEAPRFSLVPLLATLVVIGLVAFLVVRRIRRHQQARTILAPSAPRRLL